jgi:hypothetical protein
LTRITRSGSARSSRTSIPRRADRPAHRPIEEQIRPFAAAVELLCTIVGVQRRGPQCIIGEIAPT